MTSLRSSVSHSCDRRPARAGLSERVTTRTPELLRSLAMVLDPYEPRAASADAPPGVRGEVAEEVVQALRATKPWVMFIGVMFFVAAGIAALAGLVTLTGAHEPEVHRALGLAHLVTVPLYVFPGLFLVRYARAIRDLLAGGGWAALELALAQQKSFWRFLGIWALIVMGLYALVLVGVIVVAIVAGV